MGNGLFRQNLNGIGTGTGNLWSIQTELELDRGRELELNQYYFDPFTLQLEWELEFNWDHIVLL